MNPTDGSDLPPPSDDEAARRQHELDAWARSQAPRPWWHKAILIVGAPLGGLIVIGGLIGAIQNDDDNDNDGGRKMTLTEAACEMLRDGDDPEFVYSVAKDLAADHPLIYGEDESIAARAAVEQAQAQGCS